MGPAPRELLGCCGPSFGAVSLGPTPRAVRQCLVELEGTRIKAESLLQERGQLRQWFVMFLP